MAEENTLGKAARNIVLSLASIIGLGAVTGGSYAFYKFASGKLIPYAERTYQEKENRLIKREAEVDEKEKAAIKRENGLEERYKESTNQRLAALDKEYAQKKIDLEKSFAESNTSLEAKLKDESYAKKASLEKEFTDKAKPLDEKIKELDTQIEVNRNLFFGPLEDLTISKDQPLLTGNERRLLVDRYFPLLEGNNGEVVYDQVVNGVRINARKIEIERGDARNKNLQRSIVIVKTNPRDEAIAEFYLFAFITQNAERVVGYDEILAKVTPVRSILFDSKGFKLALYTEGLIERHEGLKLVYKTDGETVKPYSEHATKVLDQFRILYKRGPNVPNSQK